MKKFFLILFLIIFISSANSWESKISFDCINEKFEPCKSSDFISKKSNIDIKIPVEKNKKKLKRVLKNNKKKKILKEKKVKKKVIKKAKITKKKNLKNKNLTKMINLQNQNKDVSFEEFKNLVINYSNTSDYPDIDN